MVKAEVPALPLNPYPRTDRNLVGRAANTIQASIDSDSALSHHLLSRIQAAAITVLSLLDAAYHLTACGISLVGFTAASIVNTIAARQLITSEPDKVGSHLYNAVGKVVAATVGAGVTFVAPRTGIKVVDLLAGTHTATKEEKAKGAADTKLKQWGPWLAHKTKEAKAACTIENAKALAKNKKVQATIGSAAALVVLYKVGGYFLSSTSQELNKEGTGTPPTEG